MSKNKRFWSFIVNAATETSPESVELRIDGEIIDDDWAWLYEWFGIQSASPNKFRAELAKHAGKNLIVWIDSYGGSVFAGMGIYDALMEHKKTGAEITTIAEKAMSAATFPYMSGDKKMISLGGMLMVHNPLSELRGYGYASDFRKIASVLDEVKEAILNIYEHGTGLDRDKISTMMDNETYMSAHTAVKEGFADGVYQPSNKSEKTEVKNIMNGFMFNRLAIQNCAKNSMDKLIEIIKSEQEDGQLKMSFGEKLTQPQAKTQSEPVENKKIKEDTRMEIKTIDDLRKAYPELVAQVETAARDEGSQAERERIKSIEDIAKNIDPKLVNKAKFEEPKDAKELAFEALRIDNKKGQEHLDNTKKDSKNSGVDEVTATPLDDGGGQKPQSITDKFKNAAAQIDAKRRGIKVE